MSPKNLFFLLAVGLCATQMVSAHREARAVSDFFDTARNKLSQLLNNAESPIQSSIDTVKTYINNLESKFLTQGTNALNKAGINIDLNDLATVVKGKVKVCANNDNIKNDAMAILNDMASCVTKDVASLKSLAKEMEGLWETAQSMPDTVKSIARRCQSDEAVPEEPLRLIDNSNHELAAATNELLDNASKHLSKRSLGNLARMARCVKNIFDYAKSDLVSNIPGNVINAATHAYQLVRSVQGGIPACVATKATANVHAITKLSLQVQSCVRTGLTDPDLSNNTSMKALKHIANAANALSQLQSGGGALQIAGQVAQLMG